MTGKYLLQVKLTAKPGFSDELTGILIQASRFVSKIKGCKTYAISKDNKDTNSIYVTEIWNSKAEHDDSLKIEGVRELIIKATPILAAQPTKEHESEILGGTGI